MDTIMFGAILTAAFYSLTQAKLFYQQIISASLISVLIIMLNAS